MRMNRYRRGTFGPGPRNSRDSEDRAGERRPFGVACASPATARRFAEAMPAGSGASRVPMPFFTMTRIYRDPEDAISLRDVWTIVDGELNGAAVLAWERLRSEDELAALHREVAWAAQALLEFADLVDFTRPAKGRIQYRNYLYFEAWLQPAGGHVLRRVQFHSVEGRAGRGRDRGLPGTIEESRGRGSRDATLGTEAGSHERLDPRNLG